MVETQSSFAAMNPRAIAKNKGYQDFVSSLKSEEVQSIAQITDVDSVESAICRAASQQGFSTERILFVCAKPKLSIKGTRMLLVFNHQQQLAAYIVGGRKMLLFKGKIAFHVTKSGKKLQVGFTTGIVVKFTVKGDTDRVLPLVEKFFQEPTLPYYFFFLSSLSLLPGDINFNRELRDPLRSIIIAGDLKFLILLSQVSADPNVIKKIGPSISTLFSRAHMLPFLMQTLLPIRLKKCQAALEIFDESSLLGSILAGLRDFYCKDFFQNSLRQFCPFLKSKSQPNDYFLAFFNLLKQLKPPEHLRWLINFLSDEISKKFGDPTDVLCIYYLRNGLEPFMHSKNQAFSMKLDQFLSLLSFEQNQFNQNYIPVLRRITKHLLEKPGNVQTFSKYSKKSASVAMNSIVKVLREYSTTLLSKIEETKEDINLSPFRPFVERVIDVSKAVGKK